MLIDVAHVTSVTVAKEYRRRGFGRVQMQHLIDEAIAEEAAAITLEVRESNTPARQMYEDFGFTAIGVRKGYYTKSREDAIVMERVLKPADPDRDDYE